MLKEALLYCSCGNFKFFFSVVLIYFLLWVLFFQTTAYVPELQKLSGQQAARAGSKQANKRKGHGDGVNDDVNEGASDEEVNGSVQSKKGRKPRGQGKRSSAKRKSIESDDEDNANDSEDDDDDDNDDRHDEDQKNKTRKVTNNKQSKVEKTSKKTVQTTQNSKKKKKAKQVATEIYSTPMM